MSLSKNHGNKYRRSRTKRIYCLVGTGATGVLRLPRLLGILTVFFWANLSGWTGWIDQSFSSNWSGRQHRDVQSSFPGVARVFALEQPAQLDRDALLQLCAAAGGQHTRILEELPLDYDGVCTTPFTIHTTLARDNTGNFIDSLLALLPGNELCKFSHEARQDRESGYIDSFEIALRVPDSQKTPTVHEWSERLRWLRDMLSITPHPPVSPPAPQSTSTGTLQPIPTPPVRLGSLGTVHHFTLHSCTFIQERSNLTAEANTLATVLSVVASSTTRFPGFWILPERISHLTPTSRNSPWRLQLSIFATPETQVSRAAATSVVPARHHGQHLQLQLPPPAHVQTVARPLNRLQKTFTEFLTGLPPALGNELVFLSDFRCAHPTASGSDHIMSLEIGFTGYPRALSPLLAPEPQQRRWHTDLQIDNMLCLPNREFDDNSMQLIFAATLLPQSSDGIAGLDDAEHPGATAAQRKLRQRQQQDYLHTAARLLALMDPDLPTQGQSFPVWSITQWSLSSTGKAMIHGRAALHVSDHAILSDCRELGLHNPTITTTPMTRGKQRLFTVHTMATK